MFNSEVFNAVIGATTNSCKRRRTTTLPLFSPAAKKSKRCIIDPPPPPELTTTISDLPDCIIVEILCRISRRNVILRCKCLSKRWYNIISDDYSVSRFSCRFGTKPNMMTTHVMSHCDGHILIPPFTSTPSIHRPIFTKNFLPTFGDVKERDNTPPLTSTPSIRRPIFTMNSLPTFGDVKERDNTPIVEATFSDLVLCSATKYNQRDYYICNPITKRWIALPPTPRAHKSKVPVGFICDSYFADRVNADYRWAVVRIVPNSTPPKHGYSLEIFTSEMGEWREFQLLIPTQSGLNYFDYFITGRPGVAWNGKLYWYSYQGYTLELDPYKQYYYIRGITSPKLGLQLGVCQGRLRLYPSSIYGSITIWELMKENSGKLKWCKKFDGVPTLDMVSEDPTITAQKTGKLDVLGFLQSNEDIIYLKFPEQIVMCNLLENTLKKSPVNPSINIPFDFFGPVGWFAYVLQWWPTPVPRINNPKVSQPVPRINNPKVSQVKGNNPSSVYLLMKRLFLKSLRWTRA